MTLWLVGQIRIVVEVIGAALGVWFAWKTKKVWRQTTMESTYESLGDDLAGPRAEFIGQYRKQMGVFALIGVGLALQFVGNFAR